VAWSESPSFFSHRVGSQSTENYTVLISNISNVNFVLTIRYATVVVFEMFDVGM